MTNFDEVYARVMGKWTDEAMTGMSLRERDFVLANVCLNQCLNGGFMLYYEGSYGEGAADAVEALGRMGLVGAAGLVRRANALMGAGGPSRDEAARGEQLERLTDEALEEMGSLSDAFNEMAEEIRGAALRRLDARA